MKDYTQGVYRELIEFIAGRYSVRTIADHCGARTGGGDEKSLALVRHDVDGNNANALRLAAIDAACGLRTTFYFRTVPRLWRPEVIRRVADLGHEIGYHYEVLSDTNGDHGRARELFARNLAKLRSVAPVRTACMHGRPFSRHRNTDLWRTVSLGEFGLIGEPYMTIDYSDFYYFTDSGMTWDNAESVIRDRVSGTRVVRIRSTAELIDFLDVNRPPRVALLAHTDNWTDNPALWLWYRAMNTTANVLKRGVKVVRTGTGAAGPAMGAPPERRGPVWR